MRDAFDAVTLRPQTDSCVLVLIVYVSVAFKCWNVNTQLSFLFLYACGFHPGRPGGCLMLCFWLRSDKVEKCLIVV